MESGIRLDSIIPYHSGTYFDFLLNSRYMHEEEITSFLPQVEVT